MLPSYIRDYENYEKNHWWWKAKRKIIYSLIKQYVPRPEKYSRRARILDAGCGSGITLGGINRLYDCVGIEPNPELIEQARNNSEVPVYPGKLPGELPALGPFDFILFLDVLEHLDDDRHALVELSSLLAKDGKIIIAVPALPWLWSIHDEVNHHKRRYVTRSLKKVMLASGFDILQMSYWGFSIVPVAYLQRKFFSRKVHNEYKISVPRPFVNSFLQSAALIDYFLTKKLKIPFGLSLIAVGEKKNK